VGLLAIDTGRGRWVWSVLSREGNNPACSLDAKPRKVLVGKFLWADPAFRVHNHAVGQDARALDDRLTGNLARNPFNVVAASPIYFG